MQPIGRDRKDWKALGEAKVKVQELLDAKDKRLEVAIVNAETKTRLNAKATLTLCAEERSLSVGTAQTRALG